MKSIRGLAIAALSFVMTCAQGTTITFDQEDSGARLNGYTVNGVQFEDTIGQDLVVGDFGIGNGANSLAVFIDDASLLRMRFPTLSNSLSLDFGNDNETTRSGDLAVLALLLGGRQVGHVAQTLNRNTLIDQTITLAGINFDEALFGFTDNAGVPLELTEVVDNVSFTAADGAPPSGACSRACDDFLVGSWPGCHAVGASQGDPPRRSLRKRRFIR